jgi:transposase-like protein
MEKGVMAKKKRKWHLPYPAGMQIEAVERMKHCEDIQALAKELGVSRGALYLWRRKAEGLLSYREASRGGVEVGDEGTRKIRELEAKVANLEGELGRRSLEASFFKSALRKTEVLRRPSEGPGGTSSMRKSAAGRTRKAN